MLTLSREPDLIIEDIPFSPEGAVELQPLTLVDPTDTTDEPAEFDLIDQLARDSQVIQRAFIRMAFEAEDDRLYR